MKVVLCLAVVLSMGIVWAAPSVDIKQEEMELAKTLLGLLEEKKNVQSERSMDVYARQSVDKDQTNDNDKRESQDMENRETESGLDLLVRLLLEERRPPVNCGTTELTGSTGDFSNPGMGASYFAKTNCEWHIEVPAGKVVKLTFNQNSGNYGIQGPLAMGCPKDYVAVYDGQTTDVNKGLLKNCGQHAPTDDLISKDNHMTVVFVSDSSIQDVGFFAHWEAVDPPVTTTVSA